MSAESAASDPPSKRVDEDYAVLAACWRHPDEQLSKALEAGLFNDELSERPSIDRLRVEHTRLFVGPGDHPCPPYESVYRDAEADQGQGPVMGPSTEAVQQWYAEYGLTAGSWNDLPDHVAVELEFAGWLSARGEAEALESFLNEHPRRWLDTFAERVAKSTQEEFYAVLATATREVISDQ